MLGDTSSPRNTGSLGSRYVNCLGIPVLYGSPRNTGSLESRYVKILGIPVAISEPTGEVQGITFLVSEANIPLTNYMSIRRALLRVNQVVVDYQYKNFAFHSINNDSLVQSIDGIFHHLRGEYNDVAKYGIVGHGVGGKVALMVASMFGGGHLGFALALDPIDNYPAKFINGSMNFEKCNCPVFVSYTNAVQTNGASEIYFRHKNYIKCLYHEGAGHLAYCDCPNELPFWHQKLAKGTDQRNRVIKSMTIKIILISFSWVNSTRFLDPEGKKKSQLSLHNSIDVIHESQRKLDLDSKNNSGDPQANLTGTTMNILGADSSSIDVIHESQRKLDLDSKNNSGDRQANLIGTASNILGADSLSEKNIINVTAEKKQVTFDDENLNIKRLVTFDDEEKMTLDDKNQKNPIGSKVKGRKRKLIKSSFKKMGKVLHRIFKT